MHPYAEGFDAGYRAGYTAARHQAARHAAELAEDLSGPAGLHEVGIKAAMADALLAERANPNTSCMVADRGEANPGPGMRPRQR